MKKEILPPYKENPYYAYCGGKSYHVAQDGDVLVARERGVKLGDVRLFFYFSHENECMYYAERSFRPFWWPFIAPKIWWRKLK